MKKILLLLFSLLLFVTPVFAEEEYKEISTENVAQLNKILGPTHKGDKIVLYFFRGEGCHFCENELDWLGYLNKEYGDYIAIEMRESWTDNVNNALLKEVKELFGFEADDAVPFNVINGKAMIGISPNQALIIENEIRANAGLEPREEATEYVDIFYAEPDSIVQEDVQQNEEVQPVAPTCASNQMLNMLYVFASSALVALSSFLFALTGYYLKKIEILKK